MGIGTGTGTFRILEVLRIISEIGTYSTYRTFLTRCALKT